MLIKLLTKHHLDFLSLKGGCTGSSEPTLVEMPHCWKSQILFFIQPRWLHQHGRLKEDFIMGVATLYAKTHLRKNLNRLSQFQRFLWVIPIQYVCGKAILMCLIPILVGVVYNGIICSKTPLMFSPTLKEVSM